MHSAGVLTAGLLATAVVGCSASTDGGETTPPPPMTSSLTTPPRTAPSLDLTRAKADPCSLLSAQDLAGIPVTFPGRSSQDELPGPRCRFEQLQPGGPILSVYINTVTGGLQGLYDRRSTLGVFDTGSVSGYPTVNAIPAPDPLACSLNAGVNDAELLTVDLDVGFEPPPDLGDRCVVAGRLLAAAIARVDSS